MKKLKILICLLCVAALCISPMTGCTGGENKAPVESAVPAEESAAPMESAPAESEASPESEAPTEVEAAPTGELTLAQQKLPICPELTHISLFCTIANDVLAYVDDASDLQNNLALEKLTNIRFDRSNTSNDAKTTAYQLMIASGEYTDLIEGGAYQYTGGADLAIEDEVLIDLTDYLYEYTPNYIAILEYYDLVPAVKTNEGAIAGVASISDSADGISYGPFVRQDWLDGLNMDAPVTYDDYTEMLTAFKTTFGCSEPLALGGAGIPNGNFLVQGYGIAGYAQTQPKVIAPYYVVDGQVQYGPLTDGFKEYLTMMNGWYNNGLISQDFTSNHPMFYNEDGVRNGDIGVFYTRIDDAQSLVNTVEEAAFSISAIADPVKAEGDVLHITGANAGEQCALENAISVTTACSEENVINYCKFLNYAFSTEGSLLIQYGIQGQCWDYNESGEVWPSELITNNPDGLSMQSANNLYVGGSVCYKNAVTAYELAAYSEGVKEARDIWCANCDAAYYLPGAVEAPAENSEDYGRYYSDISTCVSENTLKFITGSRSLDEFDDYVEELKALNVEECIGWMQAGYDLYISR